MSGMPQDPAVTVPPLSLPALFLKFLRFGALAFGGPVAQIAMVREALVAMTGLFWDLGEQAATLPRRRSGRRPA